MKVFIGPVGAPQTMEEGEGGGSVGRRRKKKRSKSKRVFYVC